MSTNKNGNNIKIKSFYTEEEAEDRAIDVGLTYLGSVVNQFLAFLWAYFFLPYSADNSRKNMEYLSLFNSLIMEACSLLFRVRGISPYVILTEEFPNLNLQK